MGSFSCLSPLFLVVWAVVFFCVLLIFWRFEVASKRFVSCLWFGFGCGCFGEVCCEGFAGWEGYDS